MQMKEGRGMDLNCAEVCDALFGVLQYRPLEITKTIFNNSDISKLRRSGFMFTLQTMSKAENDNDT